MALEPLTLPFGPFVHQHWGTAAPAAASDGSYDVGDVVWNTAPAGGGATYMGWVCVTAGSPGTWKGFGLIEV